MRLGRAGQRVPVVRFAYEWGSFSLSLTFGDVA